MDTQVKTDKQVDATLENSTGTPVVQPVETPGAQATTVKAVMFNRQTEEFEIPSGTTVREVAIMLSHPSPDTARARDDRNEVYGPTDVLPTDRPKLFLSFIPNVAGSLSI